MTITVSVLERVLLLAMLPRQGDITRLRIIRDLQHQLSFTEDEHQALQITSHDDGRVTWQGEATTAITIGDVGLAVIRDRLKQLNDERQLDLEHLPLYERFVDRDPREG